GEHGRPNTRGWVTDPEREIDGRWTNGLTEGEVHGGGDHRARAVQSLQEHRDRRRAARAARAVAQKEAGRERDRRLWQSKVDGQLGPGVFSTEQGAPLQRVRGRDRAGSWRDDPYRPGVAITIAEGEAIVIVEDGSTNRQIFEIDELGYTCIHRICPDR